MAKLRLEIQITADSEIDLIVAMKIAISAIEGSCRLDESEGKQSLNYEDDQSRTMGAVCVLPEYREGDLESFFGCCPDMAHSD